MSNLMFKGWFKSSGGWFRSSETSSDQFLLRANRFLREHVELSMYIVQDVVKTQSYVAFMRLTSLASLLLFEYLGARKAAQDAAPGAAGGSSSLLHGFGLFVSSSRRVLTLTKADEPAPRAMPTVVRGLGCLSRLSPAEWDLMGPARAARDLCPEPSPMSRTASPRRRPTRARPISNPAPASAWRCAQT